MLADCTTFRKTKINNRTINSKTESYSPVAIFLKDT